MKQWKLRDNPPQSFYDKHPELPDVVTTLLYHRGLREQTDIEAFLHPDYTRDIHDPFLFADMEKVVARIKKAIDENEKVAIHGDYDADGVTGATVLTDMFHAFNHTNLLPFLPHREIDGYGLNKNTVQLFKDEGVRLIITCDCGISNADEVALAQELDMDVIISDHHTVPEQLPPAYAIIHPKVPEEPYPDKTLSGGAVAFKIAQALFKTHAKDNEVLPNDEAHEAAEKWLLDMVAISTIADMVPLLGESRTLTKYGLIVLSKTRRIGLQKLLLESRIMHEDGSLAREIDEGTIGFQIAPRINAAGRLDHANVAYQLFVTDRPTDAIDLAYLLDQHNEERKETTARFVEQAMWQAEKQQDNPFLFVYEEHWSPGFVGLIASRLKERFHKPTIAMTLHNDAIMGSGRSIDGFNLIAALQASPEHFSKFGGHPQACGFTLKDVKGREAMQAALITQFDQTADVDALAEHIEIDKEIRLEDVNWELFDLLDLFAPFGKDNPMPRYLASGVTIKRMRNVGKNNDHIIFELSHHTPKIYKAVAWGFADTERGDGVDWTKQVKEGDTIDIVFEIGINEYNGRRTLQLSLVDLKKHDKIASE